jgi:hypothetical protein
MRKKATSLPIALSAGILLVLLLFLWPLLGQPWVFIKYTDVDLNSGDLRTQVRLCTLAVKTEIKPSNLSREVRRLGIDVPATHLWKHAFESRLVNRSYVDYSYGRVVVACNVLVDLLASANAPDEERRTVLKSLMASLQTGDSRRAYGQARSLMNEMGERLNERLETLRKEQEAQTAVP